MTFYEVFVKPILFKMDPGRVHDKAILAGRFWGSNFITKCLVRLLFSYKNKKLNINVCGINFKNPVGLAAGFDKDGFITNITPCLSFGFHEVGSVTAKYCEGNLKPHAHRLPLDNALIINYGLKNEGVEIISKRLKKKKFKIPLGINIAKTNDINIKGLNSVEDYYTSYKIVKDIGDYITINISCPNVGDGRSFEDPKLLGKLFSKIGKEHKPIFLKISPEIDKKNLDLIIKLCGEYNINGFIVSNLLHNRKDLLTSSDKLSGVKGNISGKPVQASSDDLIKYLYKKTKGKFVIVGLGGIFSAEDAYRKIKNGANLVQLVTGMIYKGPGLIKKINKGLVKLLEKDGFDNIEDAIGVDVK